MRPRSLALADDVLARGAADALEADRLSLPAWIYRDSEFLEAERERVFRPSWQVVCHVSDIPAAGRYHTLEFMGETIVVIRGRNVAHVANHLPGRPKYPFPLRL